MNAIIVEIGSAEALLLMSGQASLQLPEGTQLGAIWMDVSRVDDREVRRLMLRLEHPDFPAAVGSRIARVDFTAKKTSARVFGVSVSFGPQLRHAGVA